MSLRELRSASALLIVSALVSSCSAHGSKSSEATTPAASSESSTSKFVKQSPAHGLTLEAPNPITSDKQPVKDDAGMSRINYYVTDEANPALIDVEYYTDHSQTAASISEDDKKSYADDGISVSPKKTTVKGSSSAYTFTWEQSATPPWNNDTKEINLSCQAVLADGPSGYAYGVYICTPTGNTKGREMTQLIIKSIEVKSS